jgi:hypothetical protein
MLTTGVSCAIGAAVLRYVFKPLKIKTKYKNPSHVGLEINTKNNKQLRQ